MHLKNACKICIFDFTNEQIITLKGKNMSKKSYDRRKEKYAEYNFMMEDYELNLLKTNCFYLSHFTL